MPLDPIAQHVIRPRLPPGASGLELLHYLDIQTQRDLHLGATAQRSPGTAQLLELCRTEFIRVSVGSDASIDRGGFLIGKYTVEPRP